MEDLFQKNIQCLFCEHPFSSSRVRRSRYKIKSIDTDFAHHYAGENPHYYSVYICPSCGFGFTDSFKKPEEKSKADLLEALAPLPGDFGGRRTREMAIQTYERARLCARILKMKNQILAGLTLHLAWLYREAENEKQEKEHLQQALEYFVQAYEREVETDVSLAKTLYLMGDLSRRLGDQQGALFWFGRLINDQTIRDPGTIRLARERVLEIKEAGRS